MDTVARPLTTIRYPLPSAFVQWSNKFVDPSAGFALGWAYWLSYWITIANELQAVNTVLSFWTDAVPVAAWISIFWVVIVLVNVGKRGSSSCGCVSELTSTGAVNFFAEIDVICSMIKFGWIFVVIISGIVISAGGAPGQGPIGFRYWNSTPFLNGFKGFLSVMPTCIFAMSGSENAGLVAAETKNPRKSVPRAVGSIWLRLSLFYIMGSLIVTINVSPFNKNIFGAEGTNASPFVIMYRQAGVQPLAHIMNAVIFISVVSTGSISGFGGSRTLVGLSQLGMAPRVRMCCFSADLRKLTCIRSCRRPTLGAVHGTPWSRHCSLVEAYLTSMFRTTAQRSSAGFPT